jgi:hypothetical protein
MLNRTLLEVKKRSYYLINIYILLTFELRPFMKKWDLICKIFNLNKNKL